jgi:hypothetical protein
MPLNDVSCPYEHFVIGDFEWLPDATTRHSGDLIRLDTIASAISAGTELRFISGDFDQRQPKDVVFASHKEPLQYPIDLGYSLVGVVNTPENELHRKTVFAFCPHSTHPLVEVAGITILPDGMEPMLATLLPSMETAIMCIQDARLTLGDHVHVIGLGTIGTLVGIVLQSMGFDVAGTDRNPLRASRFAGPRPGDTFDVCIELTGSSDGLQLGLDSCAITGHVVVGSFYGEQTLSLQLGLEIHRKQISITMSQVSRMHSTGLNWTKDRRFRLALELLCKHATRIKECIPFRVIKPDDVSDAYAQLKSGCVAGQLVLNYE